MARINDNLLVQLIEAGGAFDPEDLLVFIDESAGTEIAVPRSDWTRLIDMLTYLIGSDPF